MSEDLDTLVPAKKDIAWIPTEFLSVCGTFRIGDKSPIDYFLTSASIWQLEKYFSRMDEFEGAGNWGLQALFQRDISLDRVGDSLVAGYLERPEKTNFFPPLTVALVPFDENTGTISGAFPPPDGSPESGTQTLGDLVKMNYGAGGQAAYLKWNSDKVRAIVIDGQHRMAALTEFGKRHPDQKESVNVPLTIVLLHEADSALAQTRELFIDINNNARPVSDTRLIVLDDLDPFRVFTRELVADTDSAALQQLTSGGTLLPLWVVDWRSDDPNPTTGHQITTLSLLHRCVRNLFGQADAASLTRELDLDTLLDEADVEPIAKGDASPSLMENQMDVAKAAFNERLAPFISGVFASVDLYKHYIDSIIELAKGDKPEQVAFREYLITPKDRRDTFVLRKELEGIDVGTAILEPLKALQDEKKAKDNLLLLSIGQRALFSDVAARRFIYGTSDPSALADYWSADLNKLVEKGFFNRSYEVEDASIWEGVCLRQGKAAVNEASVTRLSAMISLACHALQFEGPKEALMESYKGPKLLKPWGKVREAYAKVYLRDADLDVDQDVADEMADAFITAILDELE